MESAPGLSFRIKLFFALALLALALLSCTGFAPEPALPEFSPSQSGASYVGEITCSGCHQVASSHWTHTVHARVFHTTPQDELRGKNCEACHGPGSAHINDPLNKAAIIAFTHASQSSIRSQNAMCLQCHQDQQRIYWLGSRHEINDLACSDCHNPMAQLSQSGLLRTGGINQTCFSCHQQQRADFRKRSHMPLPEGKMSCVDCHNPHGSSTDPLLKTVDVNQLCYQCHAEKRGPFIWEHAPVRENCLNCHQPHGSNHEFLLIASRPFLCQYCHTNRGHPNDLLTAGNLPNAERPDPRLINRSCQNCHVQVHGSNHPAGVQFHR